MDLKNKTVLVAGTGISGMGAVRLLMQTDARVVLYDGNIKLTVEEIQEKLPEKKDIQIIIGELTDEVISTLDIAVLSPGVPTDVDFVNRMRSAGVLIWGELELADQFARGIVLAITGTNGKTTTTTLVGEILKITTVKFMLLEILEPPMRVWRWRQQKMAMWWRRHPVFSWRRWMNSIQGSAPF